MDVLARLRSDMDDAGREASEQGENITNACLGILDEFIAVYEERTLGEHRHSDGDSAYYADGHDPDFDDLSKYQGRRVRTFVALMPRERKPSLLKAAEGMEHACSNVVIHSGRGKDVDEFHAAQRVLSEAIEKEKGDA